MKTQLKTFLLLATVLATFKVDAGQIKTSLRAESAILINAETGTVLFEKNADQLSYPASITKIATAAYILDRYGERLGEIVKASRNAVRFCSVQQKRSNPEKFPPYLLEPGAVHMKLQPEEEVPVSSLLYGLMLLSANDAANTLAEHFGGSIESFMEELNSFILSRGFSNTFFMNPHGLHHPNHQTTARDIAGIARLAMENPFFRELVITKIYECPATNKQAPLAIKQFNRLLLPGRHYYSKAIGIKTGHTSSAGFTLVAAAKQGERTLIAALLGCKEMEDRYIDAKNLFEAAFAEKKIIRTLLTQEHERFHLQVSGAKTPLHAQMCKNLQIEYFPSEEPQLNSELHWYQVMLPIDIGQRVGEVILKDEKGRVLCREGLFAAQKVEPTIWMQMNLFWKTCRAFPMTIPILTMIGAVSICTGGICYIFRRGKRR